MPNDDDVRVVPQTLYDLGIRCLTTVGIPEEHARMTVEVLIASDLRGIESHGFARFADFYVRRARDSLLNRNPQIRVLRDTPAGATIDGDGGLGFVSGTLAMRLAIEKAETSGVGMVSVRNSTHYGPASPYALMALGHNMIGISMTTGGNGVVPPGGAQRVYGLNAISFAAPTRPPEVPFCLDMAASVVAAGKLEIARRRGKDIPVGWVRDGEGDEVTDPDVYYESEGMGGILPLGSDALTGAWKGFGLAIMVDVLTGVLSGGHTSSELPRRAANHFFAAMRIDAYTDVDTFYDQMQSMKDNLRASPRLPDAGPLTFPGEPEAAFEADCRANGIPYHPSVLAGIRELCSEISVEYDLE